MKNKSGFTLAEVLIALVIVGVVAILTIPALMKNTNQKSNMTKLQTTIGDLNSLVEAELSQKRTTSVKETDIYKNPRSFLQRLNYVPNKEAFGDDYYSLNGTEVSGTIISIPPAQVLLKNGTGIGIENRPAATLVAIDINGPEKPNTVGVDYFIAFIHRQTSGTDIEGEVGSSNFNMTNAQLLASCKQGIGQYCYRLVELSSFDPEYLDKY